MMSSLVPNPVTNNPDRRRKRKKKAQAHAQAQQNSQTHAKWKSEAQQQIYSSKLIQALSQVRQAGDGAPSGGRAVREAADRALAFSAKGKTRWSRAILTNRIKLRFRKQRRQRWAATARGSNRSKKGKVRVLRRKVKGKSLAGVERKVKVLGGLVPGCRKEALPVILEEATDYIAALEMQVRTMTALAHLLSGLGPTSSSTSSSTSTSEPPPTG